MGLSDQVLLAIVTAVAALATTCVSGMLAIAGPVVLYIVGERRHQQDVDQRAAVAVLQKESVSAVHEALKENTAATVNAGSKADAAYSEANSVNLKIADLQQSLKDAIPLKGKGDR